MLGLGKYDSLRKQERESADLTRTSFNREVENTRTGFTNYVRSGIIDLNSPYVQNVLKNIDVQRREGLEAIETNYSDRIQEISIAKTQSYINTALDVFNVGIAAATGYGMVKTAIKTADNLTKEIWKTDPSAPAVEPQIPYSNILQKSFLPALNSASNILNRYNYRYNRLTR